MIFQADHVVPVFTLKYNLGSVTREEYMSWRMPAPVVETFNPNATPKGQLAKDAATPLVFAI